MNKICNILHINKLITFRIQLPFLFLFLFAISLLVNAQDQPVVVKKSTEKVLLDGQVYFIHVVKSGQTLFSICQAYGVNLETVVKENPSVLVGLQAGQVLKIPEKEMVNVPPQQDTGKYIYHSMLEGETLYSLSKRFNVSVSEIITANPGLSFDDIPVGMEIRIPRIIFQEERQGFSEIDHKYFYYKVRQGETLSTIAKSFKINFRVLKRLNRDKRKGLNVGDYVRIPRTPLTEFYFAEKPDTLQVISEKPDSACLIPIPDQFNIHLKVALLLPLYLDENDEKEYIDSSEITLQGDTLYKTIKRNKDWIYPKSLRFLEFYEGAILAIENLKQRGISTDLYVFDTEQDSIKVKELAEFGLLDDMDVIVGPIYSSCIKVLLSYLNDQGLKIPVVSPFLQNEKMLIGHPGLFEVHPSHMLEKNFIAGMVSNHYNDNIVLIRQADSLYINDANVFKECLVDSLERKVLPEEVTFKELAYAEHRPLYDTINEIGQALSDEKMNTIVVLSEKETYVSEVLDKLFQLSKDYKLNIYGFPEWARFKTIQLNYLHHLEVSVCSSYFLDYNRDAVKDFLRLYRDKLHTEPVPFSFAWTGYDVMFYFLSGLGTYGEDFMRCYPYFKTGWLTTDMEFQPAGVENGAMNTKLFLLQFSKDMKVVLVPTPVMPELFRIDPE